MDKLKIVYLKPSEITPYFRNPRKNEDAVPGVAESIKAFGFKNPILLDAKKEIIAGHTRWKSALKLEEKEVPCIIVNDLSKAQVKALRIADNKLGEKAEWDFSLLKDELQELDTGEFDMDLTGFDTAEIEEMMTIFGDEYEGKTDDDAIPEDVRPVCKTGQLWKLGNHRLLCGDATKKEDVERLMDGKKADMVFTDPPYGVDYNSKNEFLNKWDKGNCNQTPIENDAIENYDLFFGGFLKAVRDILSDYNSIYVTISDQKLPVLLNQFKENNIKMSQILVWAKNNHVLGRQDYSNKHELIVYGWNGKHKYYGDFCTTIWEIDRPLKSEMHPTMKPIELITKAINNSSLNNHIVLDLFLGSGSTLIACEKTNRICYGMEIDEHYCDVIIKRWEDYTGNKAELING